MIVAYDTAGNPATSSLVSFGVYTKPLIINEIGWGVDSSVGADQFIELKNISPYTLDLSNMAIQRDGSSAQLSGTLSPVSSITTDGYLAILQSDFISLGIQKLVAFYPALSSTGEELDLVWTSSVGATVLDRTPAVGTCSGWCAGSADTPLGSNLESLPLTIAPLSMERASDVSDGSLAASWHSTDSYGPSLGNNEGVWGTPGIANSSGLPDSGVFCGTLSNFVHPGSSFNPGGSSCTYLSRFIGNAQRAGVLYKGDIGGASIVNGHLFGASIANTANTDTLPFGTASSDHFFFAIYEARSGFDDSSDFAKYFTGATSSPPHTEYVVIPWTYAP